MPFIYKSDRLHLVSGSSELDLLNLTGSMKGHPFYLYDLDSIVERARFFKNRFQRKAMVHYAMKANSHPHILSALAKEGLGVDVVSGGEIDLALNSGFSADRIVFSGVGKTQAEIEKAIQLNIKQINVESSQELLRIAQVAKAHQKTAPVAFRLNPDVDADTHPYIKTGFRENKFGMEIGQVPKLVGILKKFPQELELVGLTIHIGSQLADLSSFAEAIDKTLPTYIELIKLGFDLKRFDVGGGLAIDYKNPDPKMDEKLIGDFVAIVEKKLPSSVKEIQCEPGRILVAPFGALFGEIQYIKKTSHKNFIILNTGMHHLLRPSLYQAYHRILPLKRHQGEPLAYDVVGPICESADVLGSAREMVNPAPGDWLAITEAGAYGYVMASHYNAQELPKELIFSAGRIL